MDITDPDGSVALFRFLQNYDRVTLNACQNVKASDLAVWVRVEKKWRRLNHADLQKIWRQSSTSVCRTLVTELFGLSDAQYATVRMAFEEVGWKDWQGLYKGKPDVKPTFALVVKLPTVGQTRGVKAAKLLKLGVLGTAGLGLGKFALNTYSMTLTNELSKCNHELKLIKEQNSIQSKNMVKSKNELLGIEYVVEGIMNDLAYYEGQRLAELQDLMVTMSQEDGEEVKEIERLIEQGEAFRLLILEFEDITFKNKLIQDVGKFVVEIKGTGKSAIKQRIANKEPNKWLLDFWTATDRANNVDQAAHDLYNWLTTGNDIEEKKMNRAFLTRKLKYYIYTGRQEMFRLGKVYGLKMGEQKRQEQLDACREEGKKAQQVPAQSVDQLDVT